MDASDLESTTLDIEWRGKI